MQGNTKLEPEIGATRNWVRRKTSCTKHEAHKVHGEMDPELTADATKNRLQPLLPPFPPLQPPQAAAPWLGKVRPCVSDGGSAKSIRAVEANEGNSK